MLSLPPANKTKLLFLTSFFILFSIILNFCSQYHRFLSHIFNFLSLFWFTNKLLSLMVDIILSGIINYNCYIAHLNLNEMTNLDKYKAAFVNSLSIDIKLLEKNLEYNTINEVTQLSHDTYK